MRLRVDEKGMVSTVRYDVDEADDAPAGVAGGDPAQTVWTDSIPPADLGVSAVGIDEFNHLRIGQRATPAVRDAVGDELWSNSGRSQERSGYLALRPQSRRGPARPPLSQNRPHRSKAGDSEGVCMRGSGGDR